MYKMKLQELCQQRRWSLPKYSAINIDGPPHNPRFKASVFVNGVAFTTSDTFNSSKEAHNQAAMKAFLKFSFMGSSLSTNEYGSIEEFEAAKPKPHNSPAPQQSPAIISDENRLSKLQQQNYFQNYARKNDHDPPVFTRKTEGLPHDIRYKATVDARKDNHDPPVFTIKTEGLPHDIRYKSTVVIDGKSFESPTLFNTIREAEQAAANIVDMVQQVESCSFKSLLHELTQREDFSKPTYKTTQIGPSHMPTFFSTVAVEELEFHGKASESKKQAEQDAAKIAYTALKECGFHMYAAFSSSIKKNQEVQSTHEPDIVKSKQKLNLEDEPLDEEISSTNSKDSNGIHNEPFPFPPNKKMKMSNMSSSSSSPKSYPFSHINDTSSGQASGSTSAESGPIALAKAQRIKKQPSWLEDYYVLKK